MSCGIYKITNISNNKCYIGQSVKIEERWRTHKTSCWNENIPIYDTPFYRALRKYGIENFTFEIIEECSADDLNDREIYWIDFYDSFNNGYNLTLGGSGTKSVDREQFKAYFLDNNPSVYELAEVFNIDRSTAGRMLKDLGLKANYYISKEEEHAICEFYQINKHWTLVDVSEKFGIDRDTASIVLKRNGIKVRRDVRREDFSNKILVYDTNGNFLYEIYESTLRRNLYEQGLCAKSGHVINTCLHGRCKTAYGLIVRYYKDDYPLKIKVGSDWRDDYWDKEGK